ncbi:restriction endonuclease subunit S [Mycoplasma zalophidermidis]|uniref:Restriction endonuclease subunit S n=1 Tax=Mycoplasma zalophidermidis TaxID=398174 RepID=A0ABS6DSD6_9MOLU|nr:restriction endonuclease subunit S [Mycoplasma zalophidermidis]MBU4693925.1 restriction endonuclease subunit S [Mycoplasma zalophidermidis]
MLKNTNDWEQRKVGDIYSFASEGGTPSTSVLNYYKNGNIPFVKIHDLKNKYVFDTDNHITNQAIKSSSAWIIPANNLLLSNGATIGKVSINKVNLATKQGILGFVLKTDYSCELFYLLFNTHYFQIMTKKLTVTTTIPTLTLKTIDKINLFIPIKNKETKKIIDVFRDIDLYISLLQCKCIFESFIIFGLGF